MIFCFCGHLTIQEIRGGIFKLLCSPEIDSKESIPLAYVAWARICKPVKEPRNRFSAWCSGKSNMSVIPARRAENRFLGSLTGLQIPPLAGRYDDSIPTRFLAPIGCYKIPALDSQRRQFKSWFLAHGNRKIIMYMTKKSWRFVSDQGVPERFP